MPRDKLIKHSLQDQCALADGASADHGVERGVAVARRAVGIDVVFVRSQGG